MALITGVAHINLVVPAGTLELAEAFYGKTLGLTSTPVPERQRTTLAWYNVADSGQQVHIAFGRPFDFEGDSLRSSRHPCFRLASGEALLELQQRIFQHHQAGGKAAPQECDEPGKENSGAKGVEYPQRFFARDYAGNRLEFSV